MVQIGLPFAIIVNVIAVGVALLFVAMILALLVLAIVFQRWFMALGMALGIVGLIFIGGFWLLAADVGPLERFPESPIRERRAGAQIEEELAPPHERPASHPAGLTTPEAELPAEALEPNISRPAWLDQPPGLRGGVYEVVVASGLYATADECQRALQAAERVAAAKYLDSLEPGAGKLVPLDPQFIRDRLRRDEFQETTRASVGLMRQSYARLAFNDAVREELIARWRQAKASERLWQVVGGAAATLLAIASAYACLVASNRRAAARKNRLAGATPSA